MKKYLLFLLIFGLASINSVAQNHAFKQKVSGFRNGQSPFEYYETSESVMPVKTTSRNVKNLLSSNNHSHKITAATKFTSSMNIFSVLNPTSKPLQFTPNINTISFIHRKSPSYVTSPFSNSGSIVGMISTNNGATWDSTCIWTSTTSIGARYPQGGIYNPLGNTNKNNAYLVACGPLMSTSIGWGGNFYASKSLNGPGTPTAGTDQQAHLDASPTIKKHSLSMHSFVSIEGGLVRSMGNVLNDPNSTTHSIYGLRGASMTKGQFNAGAFVWSVDSFIPCVMSRPGGGKYLSNKVLQAWSEDGTIGYAILLGVPCGANPCQQSYQPIIYKTTNSGSTWALVPQPTFNTPIIKNRIAPVNSNSNLAVPYFDIQEGWDAVVDYTGALHLTASVVGAYSTYADSLDYIYAFGPQQYKHPYGSFGYPTIYDFKYSSGGSWGVMLVDSMGTEFVPATEPSNPWINGMFAKFELGARIQMSRTTDGKRIFYSWTESDSTIVGLKWNIYPDIKMKSFDIPLDKLTQRINISTGITNADQQAYFHFMSNKAIGSGTNCATVPFTITHNRTLDGSLPVTHYFIDNATLCSSSYTISAMFGFYWNLQSCNVIGINENINEVTSTSIFPNPSEGFINITNTDEIIKHIFMTDNLGRRVFESYNYTNDKTMTIDLKNFSRGVFSLTIQFENHIETKKIILE